MRRLPLIFSVILTSLALLAWGVLFAKPDLVWDDLQFARRFAASPMAAAFGPFEFGQTYWRPLGTATLALGMSSSTWLGAEAAIVASKWLSLLIFAAGCFFVLSHVERAGEIQGRKRVFAALAFAALYLGCAPVFAEATIWLSARYDLLLAAVVAYGVWDSNKKGKSAARGVAIGLLLGLCKESGVVWAVMAGLLTIRAGERSYGRGLVLGGIGFAVARLAAIEVGHLFPQFFASAGVTAVASGSCPKSSIGPLPGAGALDALQSLGREALYAVAPWIDANPLHPYWTSALWTSALGLAVLVCAVMLASKNDSNGSERLDRPWLATAVSMLICHAALSAFVIAPGEAHSYAIVSGRYVCASAMVFIAYGGAWLARGEPRGSPIWVWCLAGAIMAGNLSEAMSAREAWSSGMALWSSAWRDVEHRSIVPSENYVLELAMAGEHEAARQIATEFAQSRPKGFDACRIEALANGLR